SRAVVRRRTTDSSSTSPRSTSAIQLWRTLAMAQARSGPANWLSDSRRCRSTRRHDPKALQLHLHPPAPRPRRHHRRVFSPAAPKHEVFWRQFVKTRNRNVTFRDARSFRYPAEMHDFGFALAFLSKSGATYRFFEETLLGTLPGRRYTLHRRLQKADVLIEPGYSLARIHAARSFYQRLGYTAGVFVTSSDATAVRQELTVRLADDALHGLCTLRAVMTGDTLQEMQALAEEHGLARQVDVLLLNPLDTRLPSFVLGVFPQRATPSAAILRERWELLRPLLAAVGLVVVGHCADGDPPQLSCMLARRRAALEGDKAFSFLRVPSITGGTFHVSAQARPAALPQLGVTEALLVPDLDFQDEVHGALKRRGRVLNRDGIGVWLGDGVATLRTLQEALITPAPPAWRSTSA